MKKKHQPKEPTAPVITVETQEQKQTRATVAGEAIRKILEQYHVAMVVTNLNIQTGRVLPTIEVVAQDLPV